MNLRERSELAWRRYLSAFAAFVRGGSKHRLLRRAHVARVRDVHLRADVIRTIGWKWGDA